MAQELEWNIQVNMLSVFIMVRVAVSVDRNADGKLNHTHCLGIGAPGGGVWL